MSVGDLITGGISINYDLSLPFMRIIRYPESIFIKIITFYKVFIFKLYHTVVAPEKSVVSDNFSKMVKCNQKLCSRTKNMNPDGVCNVCADVIKNTNAKHNKVDEKRRFSRRVTIDMKKMVEINEKLSQGVKVDPDVVSNLLLNGIINIIDQNECLDELEQRIKLLEHSDITNKARIESLESWILKQADSINNLDEKL